jgi:hypothetical protein
MAARLELYAAQGLHRRRMSEARWEPSRDCVRVAEREAADVDQAAPDVVVVIPEPRRGEAEPQRTETLARRPQAHTVAELVENPAEPETEAAPATAGQLPLPSAAATDHRSVASTDRPAQHQQTSPSPRAPGMAANVWPPGRAAGAGERLAEACRAIAHPLPAATPRSPDGGHAGRAARVADLVDQRNGPEMPPRRAAARGRGARRRMDPHRDPRHPHGAAPEQERERETEGHRWRRRRLMHAPDRPGNGPSRRTPAGATLP